MADQFVSCFSLQQPRNFKYMKLASCGKRSGTNSSTPNRDNHSSYRCKLVQKNSSATGYNSMDNGNGAGNSKKSCGEWMRRTRQRRQGVKHPSSSAAFRLMRFWFFRSSVHYLLKKMKALQNSNGCSGKVAKHSSSEMEISCVDAYFSVPVVPATVSAASSSFISS